MTPEDNRQSVSNGFNAIEYLKANWKELKPTERGRQAHDILTKNPGMRKKDLAAAIGVSDPYVGYHQRFYTHLSLADQTLLDAGVMTIPDAIAKCRGREEEAPAEPQPAAQLADQAEDLDCPEETAIEEDVPEPPPVDGIKQKTTQKGDTIDIDIRSSRIKNVDDLIAYCEIDLNSWDLVESTVNKWEVGAAEKSKSVWLTGKKGNEYIGYETGDTKIIIEPLFQVKARFKKKTAVINARRELEAMFEEWKKQAPVYVPFEHLGSISGNMLEANIADLHMGKLAWAPETRHDYDLKMAESMHDEAAEMLIARAIPYGLDRIVFVVGNDLMHFDNLENATTHGTVVTADTRFPKVYRKTRKMITRTVERFRQIAPVSIVMVPGNHDTVSNYTLGELLEVQFENCPDVTINNIPRTRKYMQWGKCMAMWTHGNKGKLEQYPILMATEEPRMWGDTVYREAHTGDKHQRKLIELHGVAVRILPTLCAPDDWHAENQFVGNIRSAEGYLWNQEQGVIGTVIHNLPPRQQLGSDRAA